MSLDVIAISKAQWTTEPYDEEIEPGGVGYHYGVGSARMRRDGMKPGSYLVGKGGRVFDGFSGSATGYNIWRRELSLLALGEEPETVWNHPRHFRLKPFVELIDFPDGGNFVIGPKTSAKLYRDFVTHAAKARQHFVKRSPQIIISSPFIERLKDDHSSEAAHSKSAHTARRKPPPVVEDRRWMLDVYQNFRGAFCTAKNGGFVFFW